ncbi:zinc-dependent alcohol dehydrogenase [Paenibacillus methanolicus]|uniref:zinc-dependent alcohol dehydrogenase n=1 Tax=Paenibacillus methanolicus TaxID=582686 RepID=UPI001FE3D450|nr:alcohol dehydrogenase catalytic domain-containing protein [Paenibacillus methanolicus]
MELSEIEEPQLVAPDDVKVRIELTGICGTDLAVITGKEEGAHGVIRGHEAVGVVVAVGGRVDRVELGDRVVIDPNESCGRCRYCRDDNPHLCEGADGNGMRIAGINAHGTFAPYLVTNQRFVHRLPERLGMEAAVLIEPLACVLHNFNVAKITRKDSVLILGSGPMGLLCQMVSQTRAGFTAATEVNPYRLSFARELSDRAFLPEELTEEAASKLVPGGKFKVVIDTVGTQLEVAERWVDRGGTIIPFGINGGYRHTIAPTSYIQRAVKLIGAGEYRHTFEEALRFATDHPELSRLVTKTYKLADYADAVHELLGYELDTLLKVSNESVKTVLVP